MNAFTEAVCGYTASDVVAMGRSDLPRLWEHYNGDNFDSAEELQQFVVSNLTNKSPLQPLVLSAATHSPLRVITITTSSKGEYSFKVKRFASLLPPSVPAKDNYTPPGVITLFRSKCGAKETIQRLHAPENTPANVLCVCTLPAATRVELKSLVTLLKAAKQQKRKSACIDVRRPHCYSLNMLCYCLIPYLTHEVL